ncbi:hypothetical protein BKA62DRAFT_682195 [Auriculariales sp. MPI-PUGE-AT-0066]|nr:hypothetical protein BKA62DRAFT_682195 [Auriculariales sp. MPI-PUGE-AT-0066]
MSKQLRPWMRAHFLKHAQQHNLSLSGVDTSYRLVQITHFRTFEIAQDPCGPPGGIWAEISDGQSIMVAHFPADNVADIVVKERERLTQLKGGIFSVAPESFLVQQVPQATNPRKLAQQPRLAMRVRISKLMGCVGDDVFNEPRDIMEQDAVRVWVDAVLGDEHAKSVYMKTLEKAIADDLDAELKVKRSRRKEPLAGFDPTRYDKAVIAAVKRSASSGSLSSATENAQSQITGNRKGKAKADTVDDTTRTAGSVKSKTARRIMEGTKQSFNRDKKRSLTDNRWYKIPDDQKDALNAGHDMSPVPHAEDALEAGPSKPRPTRNSPPNSKRISRKPFDALYLGTSSPEPKEPTTEGPYSPASLATHTATSAATSRAASEVADTEKGGDIGADSDDEPYPWSSSPAQADPALEALEVEQVLGVLDDKSESEDLIEEESEKGEMMDEQVAQGEGELDQDSPEQTETAQLRREQPQTLATPALRPRAFLGLPGTSQTVVLAHSASTRPEVEAHLHGTGTNLQPSARAAEPLFLLDDADVGSQQNSSPLQGLQGDRTRDSTSRHANSSPRPETQTQAVDIAFITPHEESQQHARVTADGQDDSEDSEDASGSQVEDSQDEAGAIDAERAQPQDSSVTQSTATQSQSQLQQRHRSASVGAAGDGDAAVLEFGTQLTNEGTEPMSVDGNARLTASSMTVRGEPEVTAVEASYMELDDDGAREDYRDVLQSIGEPHSQLLSDRYSDGGSQATKPMSDSDREPSAELGEPSFVIPPASDPAQQASQPITGPPLEDDDAFSKVFLESHAGVQLEHEDAAMFDARSRASRVPPVASLSTWRPSPEAGAISSRADGALRKRKAQSPTLPEVLLADAARRKKARLNVLHPAPAQSNALPPSVPVPRNSTSTVPPRPKAGAHMVPPTLLSPIKSQPKASPPQLSSKAKGKQRTDKPLLPPISQALRTQVPRKQLGDRPKIDANVLRWPEPAWPTDNANITNRFMLQDWAAMMHRLTLSRQAQGQIGRFKTEDVEVDPEDV